MNTIALHTAAAPRPLLSTPWRLAAAVAAVLLLVLASLGAREASHQAVQSAAATFSRSTTHVTLPSVEIVGRRQPAAKVSQTGAAT